MDLFFNLKPKKIYKGEYVDLRVRYRLSEEAAFDHVATIYYDILLHDTDTKIGTCDLRTTMNEEMYYYGNIGYNISKDFRGHGYAYQACLMLFKIAKEEEKLDELIITCSPENIASYKTLQKLNGIELETVGVPKEHELYERGEKVKVIFQYKL